MDKFTRNYMIVLAALAMFLLIWVFYEPPAVSRLNDLLKENAEVAAYPYRFRVLKLEDGVATMGTPRSANFPAFRALVIFYPELKNQPLDSLEVVEAQQELARIQGIARGIVARSDSVDRVVWALDTNWLHSVGIDPDT